VFLPIRCPLCSVPASGVCPACAVTLGAPTMGPFPACFDYAGAGRSLVAALKYRNGRTLAPWLAERLAGLVGEEAVDVVTWAPTGADRRRRRGFDQGEVLARALGRQLRAPVRRLLARPAASGPQTGRSRSERLAGPGFVARQPVCGHVLVVDDVVTTGATLRAAQAALIVAGAVSVKCVAVAATAPHTMPVTISSRR
jgi:predicted amidophosphoribosyltransferase